MKRFFGANFPVQMMNGGARSTQATTSSKPNFLPQFLLKGNRKKEIYCFAVSNPFNPLHKPTSEGHLFALATCGLSSGSESVARVCR